MSRSRALALGLVAALDALLMGSACNVGDENPCRRMSECDTGYACVEGTCRSDDALGAPASASAAGSSSDASTD